MIRFAVSWPKKKVRFFAQSGSSLTPASYVRPSSARMIVAPTALARRPSIETTAAAIACGGGGESSRPRR